MASPLGDSPSAQMRQASLESSPEQREDEDTGSQREQGDEREEREGEEEVSSNGAEEAPPPSPQLLLDSLTTSLKKVKQHTVVVRGRVSLSWCAFCSGGTWAWPPLTISSAQWLPSY